MLVLTRKTDEQIQIGENIKITIVRVRGNSVRIGIDAPREVRVVRGELETIDSNKSEAAAFELSDREEVFAHPQAKIVSGRFKVPAVRPPSPPSGKTHAIEQSPKPSFIGCARGGGNGARSGAPLASFIAAK